MNLITETRRICNGLCFKKGVIIAGLGRCGTSTLFRSFWEHGYRKRNAIMLFDTHPPFQAGTVYKTHDYPPSSLSPKVCLVFLFGTPMDIALSATRKFNDWGARHHRNLGSDGFIENDSLIHADTLKLADQFAAWYRPQAFPFLSLRYEAAFAREGREALADFVGVKVALPEFRKRATNWEQHPLSKELLRTYGELNETIEKADDVKIWEPAT